MSCIAWLDHPLAEQLMRFNLLPSHTVHEGVARSLPLFRAAGAGQPAPEGADPIDHRRRSQFLLKEFELAPLLSLDDPALPLAALSEEKFRTLIHWCGLALAGHKVRRTVDREELTALRRLVGDAGLDFVLGAAANVGIRPPEDCLLGEDSLCDLVDILGTALLAAAFADAGPEISRRAALRLPPWAADVRPRLCLPLRGGPEATAYGRRVLQVLDETWLSSFQKTH